MSNALKRDLGWFWYYWLFTTESVDGYIAGVKTAAGKTTGLTRVKSDSASDSNHPRTGARKKVGAMLVSFVNTSPHASGWFFAEPIR